MVWDSHASMDASDGTIVGSIDSDGRCEEYVIADISEDGAWVTMRAEDAAELRAWR